MPSPPSASAGSPVVPARTRATRTGRPSWLDARLVGGVLLVVLAVGGGAFAIAAADRSSQVWAVRAAVVPGSPLTSEDVEPRSVRFVSGELADRYLAASRPLPATAVAVRSLGAGELLPRDAVAQAPRAARVEVPLSVGAGDLPPSLRPGQSVDVWAVPTEARAAAGAATALAVRVLAGVPLQSLTTASGLGASGSTTATVTLDRDGVDLSTALGALAGRRVVLVPVTGGVPAAPTVAAPTAPGPTASPAATTPTATAQEPTGTAAPGRAVGPTAPGTQPTVVR